MTGKKSGAVYTVTNPNSQSFTLCLKGRNQWAMEQLIKSGNNGCTPLNSGAPRWSAYIHNLRSFGVEIRTITERHGGQFSGNHARYVLIAEVAIALGGKV